MAAIRRPLARCGVGLMHSSRATCIRRLPARITWQVSVLATSTAHTRGTFAARRAPLPAVRGLHTSRTAGAADSHGDVDETALREDLAAAYRVTADFGWSPDLIYNHISVRCGGTDGDPHFLLNPYGLGFEEVTASGLVKVDKHGAVVDPGTATGVVNAAGFVVHSAVHVRRPDLHAVMHTHERNAAAVSTMECGLLPLTQDAMVFGPVAYHECVAPPPFPTPPFPARAPNVAWWVARAPSLTRRHCHRYEGIAVSPQEIESLGDDLGSTARVMLLRNHGVLVGGATMAEMMTIAYFVHKACAIQCTAMAAVGGNVDALVMPHDNVVQLAQAQAAAFNKASGAGFGRLEWGQLRRRLDATDDSYKR